MNSPRCAANLLLMCIAAAFGVLWPLLGFAGQGEEEWGKAERLTNEDAELSLSLEESMVIW